MGFKTFLAMAAAAVGGIYLTSDEGKKAREALREKKSLFEPIIKKMLKQANDILEGSQSLSSKEVKANIERLIEEAKKVLLKIDVDTTSNVIKDALRVASQKIRDAANEKVNYKPRAKAKTKKVDNKITKKN